MVKMIKIISIESSELYKNKEEGYSTKFEYKGKEITKNIYTATLPNSLELQHLIKKYNLKKDKTKILINVKFTKGYKKDGIKVKADALREYFYKNGFVLDGIKYVNYKRSSSKSRTGSCLFIQETKFKDMINWSRMVIGNDNRMKFTDADKIDIASLRAYESLSLSAIESNIIINPNSILLVDDIESTFRTNASVTRLDKDNKPYTSYDEETELTNSIFDGEGLADSSLFTGKYKDSGMMLLRARFLKCCVFNCNIQLFMKEHFKENYDDATICDMFGNTVKVKDIKIITTPSSIKILKMDYKFKNKAECYKYWLNNVGDNWGIVKAEHSSKIENYNQLSYQMLNSLNLSYTEVEGLAQEEINYINLLKNDIAVFKKHIELNNNSQSRDMFLNLLSINKNFRYTKTFKDWKKSQINAYILKIRNGKIKIPSCDYCTITSNPMELLLSSVGLFKPQDKPVTLKNNEIYCTKYKDNQELCGFRNPNINQGNVIYLKNTKNELLQKYFNLTDNIVVVNSIDFYVQDRLQGQDVDSDTILLCSSLSNKAKENIKYPTPVNRIQLNKELKEYTPLNIAKVDNLISQNYIGKIVNLSQKLNSIYWDYKNNGSLEEELKEIYKYSSMLSSFSQLEIDKAKKFFNFPMLSWLKNIERNVNIINPYFFRMALGKKSKYKIMDCPMDYLQQILDKKIVETPRSEPKKISAVLENVKMEDANYNQKEPLKIIIIKYANKINYYKAEIRKCKNDEIKQDYKTKIDVQTRIAITELNKLSIKKETIVNILKDIEENNSNIKVYFLSLLFKSEHMQTLLDSFKLDCNDTKESLLISKTVENSETITLWGKSYIYI